MSLEMQRLMDLDLAGWRYKQPRLSVISQIQIDNPEISRQDYKIALMVRDLQNTVVASDTGLGLIPLHIVS